MKKKSIYERIKDALAVVSQVIITAPLKLPPKVVAVAKYLALAVGILDAMERGNEEGRKVNPDEK